MNELEGGLDVETLDGGMASGYILPMVTGDGQYHTGPQNQTLGGVNINPMESNLSGNGIDVHKSLSEQGQTGGGKKPYGGFVQYMLNFDYKTKSDLLNLAQYSLLGVGPVILLLKFIKNYFPTANDSKSSPELAFECTSEIVFILFCIYYIHRCICYIPTYSKVAYEHVNFTQSILTFLVILFTIQTKLGTKLNILINRITNVIEGYAPMGGHMNQESEEENSLEHQLIVNQPLARANSMQQQVPSQPGGDTSFGPMTPPVPIVPSSQGPGLQRNMNGNGGSSNSGGVCVSIQRMAGGYGVAAANDGFSSGSLSGAAW